MNNLLETTQRLCHTVGHSVYPVDEFIVLLQKNHINCIVDVRSSPYSKFASQYNREALKISLKEAGIVYLYMGESLGARYEDEALLFDDGKVDFEKVRNTKNFQQGLSRLIEGLDKGYKISLMCSEKEPFDCHRFVLVSKALKDKDVEIQHIVPDGLVSNDELEDRIFEKYKKEKLYRHNLTDTEEENVNKAYVRRNRDVAYNAITKEGDED